VHPHSDFSGFDTEFIGNTNLSISVNADFVQVEYDLNFAHDSIIIIIIKSEQIDRSQYYGEFRLVLYVKYDLLGAFPVLVPITNF